MSKVPSKPRSLPKLPSVSYYKKPKKIKIWKTYYADQKFSEEIRNRDRKCLRCGRTENLQNSHFWGVGFSGTRYDPENCITLCYRCHYGAYTLDSKGFIGWEYDKHGEYKEFMYKMLGPERFAALEKRARAYKGLSAAKKEYQEKYKNSLAPNPNIQV